LSVNKDKDSAGRKQPSKYLRRKRAAKAAKHRWKHKQVLTPGYPRPWSERSYANKLRHMAAARKGGATTGGKIREQQRQFWDFYHGNSKAKLHGPFTAVVETFERIEAAYDQRYKGTGAKLIAWDGFFAEMLHSFVFAPCWTSNSEDLERQMWDLYEMFMEADDKLLWGDGRDPGLLKRLHEYDDAVERKKLRLEMWRDRMMSKADKT
jgi:hypothetical protein